LVRTAARVGFLFRVRDRAVAIACALQGRTWAEQFYDPPHAVVEDSGSRTGDACNEALTGHGATERARGRTEGPHPDERGVDPPGALWDQASTPTASLARSARAVCAALTTFDRLLWVSS